MMSSVFRENSERFRLSCRTLPRTTHFRVNKTRTCIPVMRILGQFGVFKWMARLVFISFEETPAKRPIRNLENIFKAFQAPNVSFIPRIARKQRGVTGVCGIIDQSNVANKFNYANFFVWARGLSGGMLAPTGKTAPPLLCWFRASNDISLLSILFSSDHVFGLNVG